MVEMLLWRPLVYRACNNLLCRLNVGSSAKSSTITKTLNNSYGYASFEVQLLYVELILFYVLFLLNNDQNKLVRLLYVEPSVLFQYSLSTGTHEASTLIEGLKIQTLLKQFL